MYKYMCVYINQRLAVYDTAIYVIYYTNQTATF